MDRSCYFVGLVGDTRTRKHLLGECEAVKSSATPRTPVSMRRVIPRPPHRRRYSRHPFQLCIGSWERGQAIVASIGRVPV